MLLIKKKISVGYYVFFIGQEGDPIDLTGERGVVEADSTTSGLYRRKHIPLEQITDS